MSIQSNINYTPVNPYSAVPKSSPTIALYSVTATTVGTFISPDGVNSDLVFNLADLSGETIAVTYSEDGTNFVAIGNVINRATGKDTAGATLGNGTYSIPIARFGNFKHIKFTKSAGVNPVRVAVAVSAPTLYF